MDSFVGLDLGQKQDYSAVVVLERVVRRDSELNRVTWERERRDQVTLALTMAERIPLGTPYTLVARRAAEVARVCGGRSRRAVLAVDATGVGAAVVDLLREQNLGKCAAMPVLITDGDRQRYGEGRWRVPKQDLVALLERALEKRELRPAKGLELGPLAEEMRMFGMKRRLTGSEEYGGKKDDLVMALCLALWAAGQVDDREQDGPLPGMPGGRGRVYL